MKLYICDICYYAEGKIRESTIRLGYSHAEKIDLCSDHRTWGRGKNRETFYLQLNQMRTRYLEETASHKAEMA